MGTKVHSDGCNGISGCILQHELSNLARVLTGPAAAPSAEWRHCPFGELVWLHRGVAGSMMVPGIVLNPQWICLYIVEFVRSHQADSAGLWKHQYGILGEAYVGYVFELPQGMHSEAVSISTSTDEFSYPLIAPVMERSSTNEHRVCISYSACDMLLATATYSASVLSSTHLNSEVPLREVPLPLLLLLRHTARLILR